MAATGVYGQGMSKSLPLVKLQLLKPLLSALKERDIDPEPVLETVGLTLAAVEQDAASVHVMVAHQFVENCAEVTKDNTFCATVGARMDPAGWPMIQRALAEATTLGGFLNIYVTEASRVASSATPFLEVRGEQASFGEHRAFEPLITPAQNDGFMIALMVAILEKVLGNALVPRNVMLVVCDPTVLPDKFRRYQVLRGDRMGPRIQFPSEWLSRKIQADVADGPVDAVSARPGSKDFLSDFRAILEQRIGRDPVTAKQAAGLVHMGQRALARRLSERGTGISRELLRARVNYAKAALENTDRSIEDIAAALGYSDPSNFARAFARETSMSPSDYRKGERDPDKA